MVVALLRVFVTFASVFWNVEDNCPDAPGIDRALGRSAS
jgi:hypothetical protein